MESGDALEVGDGRRRQSKQTQNGASIIWWRQSRCFRSRLIEKERAASEAHAIYSGLV
jgi:hypothetical protein